MKKLTTIISVLFITLSSIQNSFAQEVCMVTADFQTGENYMVVWEKPAILTGLDSVFIYRIQGLGTVYTKIGAVDINAPSFFTDYNSNTILYAKYAISYLNSSGIETPKSLWHQGVVLDYLNGGDLVWTKYKKENQVDESYIYGYECLSDQTGFGAYSSMGFFSNTQTAWFDQTASSNTGFQYYIETSLPNCNITKANINTSRSNIKQQNPNSVTGINENSIPIISISPNPTEQFIHAELEETLIGGIYSINDVSGKIYFKGEITSKEITLDLKDLVKGTYFMNFDKNGTVITKVFIKN